MTIKEELELFRKYNGKNKPCLSEHTNNILQNTKKAYFRNQNILKAKLENYKNG